MGNHQRNNRDGSEGFLKNLIFVSGSNILQLIANVALGLLLPLLLGVEDYGYYKIYTLYVGYCGILHFGFVDGILLQFGGLSYDQLDKMQLRTFTRVFFLCELICGLLVGAVGLLAFTGAYRIIALFVGSNLVLANVTLYYQYLTQAVSRFRIFSFRKALNSAGTILLVAAFFAVRLTQKCEIDFWIVIAALQVIALILLAWYVWTYRDITFGTCMPIRSMLPTIVKLCQKGILLTIAYEVAQFMLLLDRQFVSVLFPVEVYAQYAFAYNLLSCVTTVIVAVSTVLFPMLKGMDKDRVKEMYPLGIRVITALVCLVLSGYFLVVLLIHRLIPEYIPSLRYFRIVFPAMALSSGITILMFTFYKVLDRIRDYFLKSVIALGISFGLNVFAYLIWKTPDAISVASVISIIIWYILIAARLSRFCGTGWMGNFLYALTMMLTFYLLTFLPWSAGVGMAAYLAVYCLLTCAWHGKYLKLLKQARKSE